VGSNPVGFVDPMGREKKLITESLIVSIFDLAMQIFKTKSPKIPCSGEFPRILVLAHVLAYSREALTNNSRVIKHVTISRRLNGKKVTNFILP
jgi:hypothetical protein